MSSCCHLCASGRLCSQTVSSHVVTEMATCSSKLMFNYSHLRNPQNDKRSYLSPQLPQKSLGVSVPECITVAKSCDALIGWTWASLDREGNCDSHKSQVTSPRSHSKLKCVSTDHGSYSLNYPNWFLGSQCLFLSYVNTFYVGAALSCKGGRLYLWGSYLPFSRPFWAYLRTQIIPSSFEVFFFLSSVKTCWCAQNYAPWKKPDTKGRFGKQMPGVGWGWGLTTKGHKGSFLR